MKRPYRLWWLPNVLLVVACAAAVMAIRERSQLLRELELARGEIEYQTMQVERCAEASNECDDAWLEVALALSACDPLTLAAQTDGAGEGE